VTLTSAVTIRSTAEATTAIAVLSGIINRQTLTTFYELHGHANLLVDPSHWDGPAARDFRDRIWPSYERSLTDAHVQLAALHTQLADFQHEITTANQGQVFFGPTVSRVTGPRRATRPWARC
jgi:hypothetical protein